MIDTILLDMDGVLTAFGPHACDTFAIGEPAAGEKCALQTEHWRAMDRKFWASMPWATHGKEVLRLCEEKCNNVVICTAPSMVEGCVEGKLDWLKKHLGRYVSDRRFIMTAKKHLLARPTTLLVDDDGQNVRSFISAGGCAIMLPEHSNAHHAKNPIAHLLVEMSRYTFQR